MDFSGRRDSGCMQVRAFGLPAKATTRGTPKGNGAERPIAGVVKHSAGAGCVARSTHRIRLSEKDLCQWNAAKRANGGLENSKCRPASDQLDSQQQVAAGRRISWPGCRHAKKASAMACTSRDTAAYRQERSSAASTTPNWNVTPTPKRTTRPQDASAGRWGLHRPGGSKRGREPRRNARDVLKTCSGSVQSVLKNAGCVACAACRVMGNRGCGEGS